MIKSISNILLSVIVLAGAFQAQGDDLLPTQKYVCPPCYHVENVFETSSYHEHGKCPICGMSLIEQPSSEQESPPTIHFGSGNFEFKSERSDAPSSIIVFYHKPKQYKSDSNILLILPGAGRNAWGYRDSWVALSEKYNVLVVCPFYPEKDYDYAAYHLAGVTTDIEFKNYTVSKVDSRINKYHLADDDIVTGEANHSDAWLFRDFDDIFEKVVQLAQSTTQSYDIFGHSAGGQILHRMAMFQPSAKADRIVASNSGTYTLPNFDSEYPLGLKRTAFSNEKYPAMFSRNLTLLIGDQDDETEQRGTMLHTPSLDKQGLGSLSRGKHFYRESMKSAEKIGSEFAWKFCTVEDVGHNYKKMGDAAAEILYGGQKCVVDMSI